MFSNLLTVNIQSQGGGSGVSERSSLQLEQGTSWFGGFVCLAPSMSRGNNPHLTSPCILHVDKQDWYSYRPFQVRTE